MGRITWQHSLGNCILKAHFEPGTKELNVSQYQAMVLINCFNTGDAYTIHQVMQKTGITDQPELERVLLSLSLGKEGTRILLKQDHDANLKRRKEPRKTIHPNDTFHFLASFTSKLNRIKITQIQLKETPQEREQ